MSSQTADSLLFDFLPQIPVVVQRHSGQMSSDAGLLPIMELDRRKSCTARPGMSINVGDLVVTDAAVDILMRS